MNNHSILLVEDDRLTRRGLVRQLVAAYPTIDIHDKWDWKGAVKFLQELTAELILVVLDYSLADDLNWEDVIKAAFWSDIRNELLMNTFWLLISHQEKDNQKMANILQKKWVNKSRINFSDWKEIPQNIVVLVHSNNT